MRRLILLVAVLVVLASLGGCGNAAGKERPSESAFLAGFSLAPILEANEEHLIAKHISSGDAVSEPPLGFFQKHEVATVKIDETNTPAFMEAVRSDIERDLVSSGATIHGQGRGGNDGQTPEGELPDTDYYSLRYRQDSTEGAVNIWGVRGAGTNFVLIVLITESQGT
ncbi:MAG: hypothetical protein PVF77_15625 [Anaerolineae bacterium]|jgi:hypothetical protein